MVEKGLIITGSDAELLDRALSEVKTKAYEKLRVRGSIRWCPGTWCAHFVFQELQKCLKWWTGKRKKSLIF